MKAGLFLSKISCSLLLLASCKPEANHLSQAQMEQLLLDVHLAEAYSSMVGKDSTKDLVSKNQDSLAVYYYAVFDHHHITREQFTQSMDWYREHPDELDTIYSHIVRRLDTTEKKPGRLRGR